METVCALGSMRIYEKEILPMKKIIKTIIAMTMLLVMATNAP